MSCDRPLHPEIPPETVTPESTPPHVGAGLNLTGSLSSPKQPRTVCQEPNTPRSIVAFPPNRDTLGGTAYLLSEAVNLLVDCPAWDASTQKFLQDQGSVRWLFLTHRGGIGKAREIQQALGCEIVMQEQEAYLLPGLSVKTFHRGISLTDHTHAIWTPGHSPGSACLYYSGFGGVLFSGRHLLPAPNGSLQPIRTATTFHWRRQIQSVRLLLEQFTPDTLRSVCPGANTGFLRGRHIVGSAYEQLSQTTSQL